MMKRIKVYGERNTNTTYMSRLIELNLEASEVPGVVPPAIRLLQRLVPGQELVRDLYFAATYARNLGWKHMRVRPAHELSQFDLVKDGLAFVTLTKNPYSWLLSLYRSPYHQYVVDESSFETFLRRPWKATRRDNTQRTIPNPVELWNIKNASYLGLGELQALGVKTEEVLADPQRVIERISQHFSIPRRAQRFLDYEQSTKEQGKDSSYYRDYYLTEKWKAEISDDAIAIINASLDQTLMAHFAYTLL